MTKTRPRVGTGKPRNRKAQDSTLINIDALKKRVTALEAKFDALGYLNLSNSKETLDEFFRKRGIGR